MTARISAWVGLLLYLTGAPASAQSAGSPIAANPKTGPAPLRTLFTVSIPSGGAIDFGDGTTGELHPAPVCYGCPPLATAAHVYQRPGSYTVRLLNDRQPVDGGTVVVRAN